MKMWARVITTLLVTSLFLSGCGYQYRIAELESELAQKEEELQSTQDALEDAQVTVKEQESEVARLENDIGALEDEITMLEGNLPERARLNVELLPNPVLPDEKGMWRWHVNLESMNPIGVHLKTWIVRRYWKGELVSARSHDETELAEFTRLEDAYLPPYSLCSIGGGFPRQALDELGIHFVAVDDNGNIIETQEVKVALVQ